MFVAVLQTADACALPKLSVVYYAIIDTTLKGLPVGSFILYLIFLFLFSA